MSDPNPQKITTFLMFDGKAEDAMLFDDAGIVSITPSISLCVQCASEAEIDHRYTEPSDGGETPLPLESYGVGVRFGWVTDQFGVSWQLMLA